ncbi:MAG: helix-turn-helix domain-containing protein [Bacteroidales bacterium]|nr:helix-turn-helix domain-containing protein [Bacteroidales bacterium]
MKKPNVNPTEPYTVPEACMAMGITRRTLYRYTEAGALKAHRRKADNRIVFWGKDLLNCYYSTK